MGLGTVDYGTAQKHVMSLLNSSINYSSTGNDVRHPDLEVGEAVLEADAEVCRAIIDSNSPFRNNFLNTVALFPKGAPLTANGTALPVPTTAPTVAALAGGILPAGQYTVGYAWQDSNGLVTPVGPTSNVTLTAGQQIQVTGVTLIAGAVNTAWYVQTPTGSTLLFSQLNTGGNFQINALPLPSDAEVLMPNYIGDLGGIEILRSDSSWVTGKTAPLAKILMWKANPGNIFAQTVTNLEGYYEIVGNRIDFTGQAVRLYLASQFQINRGTPQCQAPDIYYSMVVAGSLGMLMAKEGDDVAAAQYYQQYFLLGLKSIRDDNEGYLPELTKYVEAR